MPPIAQLRQQIVKVFFDGSDAGTVTMPIKTLVDDMLEVALWAKGLNDTPVSLAAEHNDSDSRDE